MKPHQYHLLLVALDQAISAVEEFACDLSSEDVRFRDDLQAMREQILRAASGHPFPFKARLSTEVDSEFDMTATPWFK